MLLMAQLKRLITTQKTEIENKNTDGLISKTSFNSSVTEIEYKIPDSAGLAIRTLFIDYNTRIIKVGNKIPDNTDLIK